MKPNNPFLIEGYHSPEYFCDRQKETEALLRSRIQFLTGNRFVFAGSRRQHMMSEMFVSAKHVWFELRITKGMKP